MKKGLTEIVFILDCSGSMAPLTDDTIGGFNAMIDRQRHEPGEALVSTVLFDGTSRVLHDRAPLEQVRPMTRGDYCPQGCTALLDAMGDAIRHIGNVHKYARAEDVPQRTLFVVTTDGMENASRRYIAPQVRAMIERQKRRWDWEFLFLGANIDAVETARSLGIDESRAANYHSDMRGTALNYEVLADAVADFRATAALPREWKARIDADFKAGR